MTIAIHQKITVEKAAMAAQLDDLLHRTQSLSHIQNITEEEIAEEITAYRAGIREDSD